MSGTNYCWRNANHSSRLLYIAAAALPSQVARVAIAAIATDRERFVGGVHFPMASVKKCKNLDFATKLKAIQRVEAGKKSSAVVDDIGIPWSMLSTLLKIKADIKAKAAEQLTSGACRVRAPAHGKLSSLFPAAVPPEVSADDFVEADCNVQPVASLADEDIVAEVAGTQDAQANSSSGDEDRPDEAATTRAYSAAEVAAAFGLIRRCCGDMEGTGLSHLDSLDKIEASVFNFISKTKKQAKIRDFFSRK
ncbi:hypothetical protein HPB52_002162 [Rhipicephalus sanguineus]|uniref:HTH psq-type domain-containing protein n=1 Tax=Rhipicephalus sanguineus TaxID=34632 RepID=A0A9D4T3J2_RHISA|nr:hypothetical protein HPB52_002162 [Rhipicephalus sanguineus]